ncbi:MAG TPA: hypothetical protein PLD57_14055, partial [Aggregatilineales bacterium]|nr:hypothetical protein [Aggregatilineales bacterium]
MHRSIRAIIVLALLLVLTAAGPLQETPPAPTSRAVIDSPAEGDVVAGLVTVTGTVVDPAFESYDLEYAPDPTLASVPWTPVQGTVTQQVSGGVLGAWDTTTLPDGRYVLRLRMNRRDDMPIEYEVRVVVANATPTPTSPPPTRTPTAVPGTPTPGPSPTPLIEQPPTRTPRPAAALGPTPTPGPAIPADSPLRPDRLIAAARTGALIAVGTFGLLGLYALVRASERGELGEGFWRVR